MIRAAKWQPFFYAINFVVVCFAYYIKGLSIFKIRVNQNHLHQQPQLVVSFFSVSP